MLTTKDLAVSFARSLSAVQTALQGISDTECMYQPPFNSNCVNWTLGHILENRNHVLKVLGEKPILTEEQAKRYGYGSPPVCQAGSDVLKLDEMLRLLEESQPRIEAGMAKISPAALAKEIEFARRKMTVEHQLLFMLCHDFTHAGELDVLKSLVVSCRPGPRGEEIYGPGAPPK